MYFLNSYQLIEASTEEDQGRISALSFFSAPIISVLQMICLQMIFVLQARPLLVLEPCCRAEVIKWPGGTLARDNRQACKRSPPTHTHIFTFQENQEAGNLKFTCYLLISLGNAFSEGEGVFMVLSLL